MKDEKHRLIKRTMAELSLFERFKELCAEVNKEYSEGGIRAARKKVRTSVDKIADICTDEKYLDIYEAIRNDLNRKHRITS